MNENVPRGVGGWRYSYCNARSWMTKVEPIIISIWRWKRTNWLLQPIKSIFSTSRSFGETSNLALSRKTVFLWVVDSLVGISCRKFCELCLYLILHIKQCTTMKNKNRKSCWERALGTDIRQGGIQESAPPSFDGNPFKDRGFNGEPLTFQNSITSLHIL